MAAPFWLLLIRWVLLRWLLLGLLLFKWLLIFGLLNFWPQVIYNHISHGKTKILLKIKFVHWCVIETNVGPKTFFQQQPCWLWGWTASPRETLNKAARNVRWKTPEGKKRSFKSVALTLNHLVTNDVAWRPISNTSKQNNI